MRLCAYALAIIGALGLSGSVAAQQVTGRVRESSSAAPVPGAVVSVLDSTGHLLARTVSGVDGQYRVAGNGHGTSVHVIRIGFRPATRVIRPDRDSIVDIDLTVLPALLETVEVREQTRCPQGRDVPGALALWEQARSALLATVVGREVDPPTVRVVSYIRTLDTKGRRIEQQTVSDSIYVASRPLVAARTAAQFAARGYRDGSGRGATYYAPDAEVLLDSTFSEAHCLSVAVADSDHAGDVGIAFAPRLGQDSVVDVAGVLWLKRDVPALHTLSFRFTNLSSQETDAGTGGDLSFTVMPNGVAMIGRWNLRVPVIYQASSRGLTGREVFIRGTERLVGVADVGGELAEASWHDGSSWVGPLATISGHVVVGGTGAPLVDAPVRIHGSRMETRTDSSGAFTLPLTVPGPYVLEASDELMTKLGVASSVSDSVMVDRSPVQGVRLVLPSRKEAITSLCYGDERPAAADSTAPTLIIGRVRLAGGAPASDALVRANWVRAFAWGQQTLRGSGLSDSNGSFVMCGVAAGVPLTLNAARDSLVSPAIVVTVDSLARTAVVDMILMSPSDASLPSFRRRRLTVTDDASGAPLAGVEVVDAMTDGVLGRTAADGTIGVGSLPDGRAVLRVRKLGYEQRTLIADIAPENALPIVISLRTVAQLKAVTVTAAAIGSRLAASSGFEDRAKLGLGRFLRVGDLERHSGENLADALQAIGVKQREIGSSPRSIGIRSIVLFGGHGRSSCPVTIYIDGVLIYSHAVPGAIPPDAGTMYATDYAGAEYYAGGEGLPAEYSGTDSGCGVLLLWRKD